MSRAAIYLRAAILLTLAHTAHAQTVCGSARTGLGAFICYPAAPARASETSIPEVFHLSAQGNAPPGRLIRRYIVLVDGRPIYENRLAMPMQQLSIETNVKSPFTSGVHTLSVVIDGAGSAEVAGLRFHPATHLGFCDPFSRVDGRACLPSKLRGPLRWSLTDQTTAPSSAANPFAGYLNLLALYSQSLKSVEADTAEAVTVDSKNVLYTASHSAANVELRKYAPDSSLTYDDLVASCGPGSVSIVGIAASNQGLTWIAGNTTTCLPTTPGALEAHVTNRSAAHGFVIVKDTTKSGPDSIVYSTYLSRVENRLSAIRVDKAGNAYLTGTTSSMQFPHDSTLTISENMGSMPAKESGFVSMLNPSGSALLWSTLLPGARLNALAIDGSGTAYVTGRSASKPSGRSDVLIAALSDKGRRLSYLARLGGSGNQEGRAIATTESPSWLLVTGETDSPDFRAAPTSNTVRPKVSSSFAVALQPCKTGVLRARLLPPAQVAGTPEIAAGPALDAFARSFSESLISTMPALHGRPQTFVQASSICPAATP